MKTAQVLLVLCAASAIAVAKDLKYKRCNNGDCSPIPQGKVVKQFDDTNSRSEVVEHMNLTVSFNYSSGDSGQESQMISVVYTNQSPSLTTSEMNIVQESKGFFSTEPYDISYNVDIHQDIHLSESSIVYQNTGKGTFNFKGADGSVTTGSITVSGRGTITPPSGENMKFLMEDTYETEIGGQSFKTATYSDLRGVDDGTTRVLSGIEIVTSDVNMLLTNLYTEIPSPGVEGPITVSATGMEFIGDFIFISNGTGTQWYTTEGASSIGNSKFIIPLVSLHKIVPLNI